MICRFCSQWNPEDERRCCFCHNPLDAPEDTTATGRPAYERKATAKMIPAVQSKYFPGQPRAPGPVEVKVRGVKLKVSSEVAAGIGAGLLILIMLIASQC